MTIEWPEVPELHRKELPRQKAKLLVDWAVDCGRDQTKLPPPYTAIHPNPGPGAVATAPPPPPDPPRLALDPPNPGAAEAAAQLRAALDSGQPLKAGAAMHIKAGRNSGWFLTFPAVSGLRRFHGQNGAAYTHALLPAWEYQPAELREMLGDLEDLAAGKGQPTKETTPVKPPPVKPPPAKPAAAGGNRKYQRDENGRLVF
ncbi:hypothetical protein [Rhodovastum atsumiense]|uniref:Uncharacterized protein n=1 Tax=Rhodovastum atsumiense TaxID=504468 RepID=A0A5M6IUR7_9PROT|nr:hypothetical protein [Rhodovastum atsumiense]KAA5611607.1 hypothetical protein F1189_13675 [Rhodovastum atsumiense]